jgi:hypothetical protein
MMIFTVSRCLPLPFLVLLLSFVANSTHSFGGGTSRRPCQHHLVSRRDVLHKVGWVVATGTIPLSTTARATPVVAANAKDDKEEDQRLAMEAKEAAKHKKEQEKEAKRVAEETKKRLAVGRIGMIGAL